MLSHPTTEDLEGFLRAASQPGHAERNARVLRHLLASCQLCRDRLQAMGWSSSRLERLVYLAGGRREEEEAQAWSAKKGYDYDRAFARTEQVVEEFLATAPPPSLPVERLLEELDHSTREAQLARAEGDERFAIPQLVPPLLERSHVIR